jgi:beta-glucosidase
MGVDWEVYPDGLRETLVRVHQDYAPETIYVTENGSAFDDPAPENGVVHDPQRTAYMESHLQAVADAMAQGVPVKGYFAWSLLDNFEWAEGYEKRFGMVYVDYATQERTPKDTAWFYRDFIKQTQAT